MSDPIDLASEATKQILTLSTAIITVGFAYVKDIAPKNTSGGGFLVLSVVPHLASCLFGIMTMMAITGIANDPEAVTKGIYGFNVRFPSSLQIGCFFLGLCSMCMAILGVKFGKTGPSEAE